MISINGTYKEISMVLPSTTIGTCDYTARIFDVTGEVLHDAIAINGLHIQWITAAVSLATIQDDAIAEIAKQHPEPTLPPIPTNW